MTFRRQTLAAGLGIVTLLSGFVLPVSTAAADVPPGVTVEGTACVGDEGVTVMVDFTPVAPVINISCAVGPQVSVQAAFVAAGYTVDAPGGFVGTIDGVAADPAISQFWALNYSTSNGLANGSLSTDPWTFAQEGIVGTTPRAGLAVSAQLLDWNVFPPIAPSVPLADLTGYVAEGESSADLPSYPAGQGNALAAAGWLGRQLAANGGVAPGPDGGTDWGLTIDALLALAAAGVGGDQIDRSAAALYGSGEAFIGAPPVVEFGQPNKANFGAIAKMVLALQVAGHDPTTFPGADGPRNLLGELRTSQNADGSFGADDNAFSHSLIIFALARTEGGTTPAAVAWLEAQQCLEDGANNGSFGFGGCSGADIDTTALAVQALKAAGVGTDAPSVGSATTWMLALQSANGSLPSQWAGENTNSSGLGGQALLAVDQPAAAAAAAGFVGSLEVSCATVLAQPGVLTDADTGAIALNAAGWTDLAEYGIDNQWLRATAQAMLALGLPDYGSITASGAAAALPVVPVCAPPVEPSETVVTPSPLPLEVVTSTTIAPSSTTPVLSATGVDGNTGPTVALGLLLLFLGAGLVLAMRVRVVNGRHHH